MRSQSSERSHPSGHPHQIGRVLTVHPLPHACREAGLLLGADPHQLCAQLALAPLQLGQYEIVRRPLEVVYEVAAVRLTDLARPVEGLAARDVELVAGARERRQNGVGVQAG